MPTAILVALIGAVALVAAAFIGLIATLLQPVITDWLERRRDD